MVSTDPARGFEPLRILVTDGIMCRFEPELTANGGDHNWSMASTWSAESVLEALPETDVLVCSSMTPAMAAAAPGLRLVHVTGAGYDKIPLAALAPGVSVANTFHHGRPIAEHVVMVSFMLSRRVLQADREMRGGTWRTVANDAGTSFHATLRGRTMGLLGFGGIGQEIARLAGALGMRIQAIRQNPAGAVPDDIDLAWVGGLGDLPRLMSSSDIVVVTVPLSEATTGVIGAEALAAMRPTGILINVARGAIVQEDALHAALVSGVIAGAALDVWWGGPGADGTPPPSTQRFAGFENVILTPHYSGHARSTFELRAADIAGNIDNLAAGRPLFNVVRQPVQRQSIQQRPVR